MARYARLQQSDREKLPEIEHGGTHQNRHSYQFWLASIAGHALIFLTYTALFYFGVPSRASFEECAQRFSSWSPGLPAVEGQVQYLRGKFSEENDYKGTPNETLDHAWDLIGVHVPGLRLQEEDFASMGKSLTERNWHRIPEEHGGGYLAMTEVFHLLHCLNELRKFTFPDHYPDLWAKRDTPGTRTHTDHCIDIIRQRIMCTGDVGPVPIYDSEYHSLPMPDFSTRHYCRNFDKLLEWGYNNDRSVKWDAVGELHKPDKLLDN